MSPAEQRADIIVDFAGVKFGKAVTLFNYDRTRPSAAQAFDAPIRLQRARSCNSA